MLLALEEHYDIRHQLSHISNSCGYESAHVISTQPSEPHLTMMGFDSGIEKESRLADLILVIFLSYLWFTRISFLA
jgi:hypothetical protein